MVVVFAFASDGVAFDKVVLGTAFVVLSFSTFAAIVATGVKVLLTVVVVVFCVFGPTFFSF